MSGRVSATVQASRAVDVGRLLDEAGWSGFQKRVLALVSIVIVLDGLDTQTLTLAIPSIIRDWHIGRGPFGVVIALGFVAMAIGTGLGGMLGDRLGRRGALLASTIIFGLGTLAGAATHDVWWLGATRIFASVGLGAAMPNATAMVAEYTPLRRRSLGLGIAMGSQPIGTFIGGMLAAFILPHGSWQALFIVCGIIPLLGGALLLALLPESIRFLLNRRGAGPRIAAVLAKMGQLVAADATFADSREDQPERASVAELFRPAHRRDTLVLAGALFLVICTNLFVLSWTPSLLATLGYHAGITSAGVAAVSLGGLVGAIGGGLLFQRIGSRRALMLMTAGAAVVALVLLLTPLGGVALAGGRGGGGVGAAAPPGGAGGNRRRRPAGAAGGGGGIHSGNAGSAILARRAGLPDAGACDRRRLRRRDRADRRRAERPGRAAAGSDRLVGVLQRGRLRDAGVRGAIAVHPHGRPAFATLTCGALSAACGGGRPGCGVVREPHLAITTPVKPGISREVFDGGFAPPLL